LNRIAAIIGTTVGIAFGVQDAQAHVHGCRSKACDRRVHRKRAAHWCRTHAVCLWRHRWNNLPSGERSWARCIADHETRGYPWSVKARVATGNGYYGSTQWLPAPGTAPAAPACRPTTRSTSSS
jgi:hypothetical protein